MVISASAIGGVRKIIDVELARRDRTIGHCAGAMDNALRVSQRFGYACAVADVLEEMDRLAMEPSALHTAVRLLLKKKEI